MELLSVIQENPAVVSTTDFDLVLAASGYEKRCNHLFLTVPVKAHTKVAFGFNEKQGISGRATNDEFFQANNFSILTIAGEELKAVISLLSEITGEIKTGRLKVLIDYSCMTSQWYGSILRYFLDLDKQYTSVDLYFSYTFASFEKPARIKEIHHAGSIYPDKKPPSPNKPTALILGLGMDKLRSSYLVGRIRPDLTYIMYADPSPDQAYIKNLFDVNREIITSTNPRNMFNYPLTDVEKTYKTITSLCLDLRLKYNIVLAPMGPKIHALLCILVAARYPDIDVWRVSAGSKEPVYDKIPVGEPVILKARLGREDE